MAGEKVISTAALIAKFQQALDEKWGYIWGTEGEMWTAEDQKKLEKTTDADKANSRKYGSTWIGHRVADCSGLFYWAFRQLGGVKIFHGSNTIWNDWCVAQGDLKDGKRTDGKPLLPGTAVFTYNKEKNNRGHIGLYIGNGWVIEASSPQSGVIRSKVTASKWVEWGELKGVDYSGTQQDTAPEPETAKVPPTIRKGNKNVYVKQCQQMLDKLGYNLGICGVDSDFGTATEKAVKEFQRDHGLTQDGVVGPKTWTALQDAVNKISDKPPPAELYSVVIPHMTAAQADAVIKQYPGAFKEAEKG